MNLIFQKIYKKAHFSVCILLMLFVLLLPFPIFADDIDYQDTNQDIIETSTTTEKNPTLNARSCIVLDRTSKHILFGKNENNKVKMASTTKIMTAIVIIENNDLNQTIEVSKKAAGTGGSRLGLKTGDKITIRDLLYGLMLCSGNDAAVALAESTSGSIQDFSELMNKKALELGLTNTHFESPHGLDSNEHYTTAYELAKLSDYALNNKTFLQIVGTKNYTVTINGYPKNLSNTNELLGNLNGVYGIKTGFTNGANRCLVTACKRNNMDIITVVLGCDTKKFRTQDSIKLIEYSFNTYEYINIKDLINKEFEKWENENINAITINKGLNSNVNLSISPLENPIIPVKKEEINNITYSINIEPIIYAPINQNDIIGTITVSAESNILLTANIIINNDIKKKNIFNYFYEFIKNYSQTLNSSIELK